MNELLPTLELLAQKSAARFANWNSSLFQSYCQAMLPRLVETRSTFAPGAAAALAEMLCEGIGSGYLTMSMDANPLNLMEYCFRDWLVPRLASIAIERQLQFLAETWNLLEGLLREPLWVNAYVMARSWELPIEASLESFLAHVLKPLFEPASTASWSGPFRVTLLSLRSGDDDFLPGDMRLIAPMILVVVDRRRKVAYGVILRKEGQSELAGLFGDTSRCHYIEQPSTPTPRWQGEWMTIGSERIRLPFLGEPFRWLQIDAGFVVASAVHSQKLWIVESIA